MTLEAQLAARMLAFERKQAVTKNRNGNYLRPTLPCDLGAKIGELNAQQIAIVSYLKKVGPCTSTDVSKALNMPPVSAASHLSNMSKSSVPITKRLGFVKARSTKGRSANRMLYGVIAHMVEDL